MSIRLGLAVGSVFLAVFSAGCGAGGSGGDNNNPPTTYKYYAFVANASSERLAAYVINADTGALTAVPGSPLTGHAPVALKVEPKGKFVYVANRARIRSPPSRSRPPLAR